jgi:hypothetical protein
VVDRQQDFCPHRWGAASHVTQPPSESGPLSSRRLTDPALPLPVDIVVSSMSFRLLFAALAVVLIAAGLLAWQPWTGRLEGNVYLTACGGTQPANPPPGYKNCNTALAAGAQVTASPVGGGSSVQALADSNGHYNLRLTPGQYYLWGVTTRPYHVRGERRPVSVSANTTVHVDVGVTLHAV